VHSKENDMRILVCNDDGITAPGIKALVEVANEFGEIHVVAPNFPRSATAHAITVNTFLTYNHTTFDGAAKAYSCSGTPADCIKLGLHEILDFKPDLILSGINHGANTSVNVLYSGTMGAALEGMLNQIPSIGFSVCDFSHNYDLSASKEIVRQILTKSVESKLNFGCLNVNIPALTIDKIKGIKLCRQSKGAWNEDFTERNMPFGKPYFWMEGEYVNHEKEATDTDMWAIENGYVSVVPTGWDLTNHQELNNLKDKF